MRSNKGFTLIEMVVVCAIIATLAAIALPRMSRTVETSRAYDAIGILNNVAAGMRMLKSDWPAQAVTPTGSLSTSLNTTACPSTGKPTTVGEVIGCKYVTPHDWDNYQYLFYACENNAPSGTCCVAGSGENRVACADRRDTTDNAEKWFFWIDNYGGCHSGNTTRDSTDWVNPSCPKV